MNKNTPLNQNYICSMGVDGAHARIYGELRRADVLVRKEPEQRQANDYQLWVLRDDGVPVSLGLLPQTGER